MKGLTKIERKVLVEATRILQTLKEYTGGDGWQKVKISDDSWQDLEVGIEYNVKGMPGVQKFLGWVDSATLKKTDSDDPTTIILLFRDIADGDIWEAYDYGDTFAWGSGATPLIVKDSTIKRKSPTKRTSRY